jgi:hypothetical protein
MIGTWWHRRILKHTQNWRRVTVPLYDMRAKGYMVYCDCGKSWAL